jgi:hypothetical protein
LGEGEERLGEIEFPAWETLGLRAFLDLIGEGDLLSWEDERLLLATCELFLACSGENDRFRESLLAEDGDRALFLFDTCLFLFLFFFGEWSLSLSESLLLLLLLSLEPLLEYCFAFFLAS